MKVLVLAILVLTLIDSYVQSAAVLRSASLPHNLYECDPTKPKVRVLQRIVQKSGRAQTVINEAVQYPRFSEPPTNRVISCIVVEDLSRNGKGAYAEIVAGGVGHNYVTISFESQKGEDIQFALTIYAFYTGPSGNPLLTASGIGRATIEP